MDAPRLLRGKLAPPELCHTRLPQWLPLVRTHTGQQHQPQNCTVVARTQPALRHASRALITCRSRAGAADSEAVEFVEVTLQAEGGGSIRMLGVTHSEMNPELGDQLLDSPPGALLLETALGPEHGKQGGREFTPAMAVGEQDFEAFVGIMGQIAGKVVQEGGSSSCATWQQVRDYFPTEQLLCIAAFAKGVPIVYADRPKPVTWWRIASQLSLEKLDQSFEAQAVRDTVDRVWELSTGGDPSLKELAAQAPSDPLHHIFMAEREAAMCHVMADVSTRYSGKELVAVVGENHVHEVEKMWKAGDWRATFDEAGGLSQLDLPTQPALDSAAAQRALQGSYRALLELCIGQRCPPVVLASVNETLGLIDDEAEADAYQQTLGIYGHPRMLLAVLPEQIRRHLCCEWHSKTAFEGALGGIAAVRPLQGGKGYGEQAMKQLEDMAWLTPDKVVASA